MVVIEFGTAENQTLDSNSLFLRFTGPDFKENLEKIKGYWNRKFLKETKEWEVPFSCWSEIKELYANSYIKYINEPPKAKLVSNDDIIDGMDFNGYNLYDYQLEGVRYGLNHHNFLLLDEQGLGKTLQLITLARYRKIHQGMKHCLIICGVNSLKFNWEREVKKFCKDEDAIILGTRKNSKGRIVALTKEETIEQIDSCPEQFFWIINIEKIRVTNEEKKEKSGLVHHLNKYIESGELGMIAIDECHKCVDYDTLITTDKGNLKIGDIVENSIDCNVLSYNDKTDSVEWKPIVNRFKNNTSYKNVVEVIVGDKRLVCTNDHKIYTINRGWVEAKDLNNKDIVQLLGYNTLKVESVEEVDGRQFMYDIEVDGNHNYFANNLLVHNCKNIKSSQAQGILELDPKAHKVGMTGTLLVNNPLDLYCPMSFVGLINYSKWAFDNKYVLKDDWGRPIGFQNMEELHEILYKSSIRRTKDLLDLPPKIYKPEWLEFSPEEWKVMYDIMSFKYKGKYLDKIDPILDPIVMVTRMRQCTVAPELITSNKIPSTKFNRLNDILEEARLNGQKVLVFCPFTEALELGMEYCKEYQPKLIKGGMGSKIQETIDAHENTNGFSVIFAQEATLGVGFTLTNTEICVFLSPPWNKATYDQCSDRIHRIGQKKTVQIIDLYIAGTYDEDIHDKLHGKGAMADIVIDGKEGDELTEALSYINRMGITFNKKARETQKLF